MKKQFITNLGILFLSLIAVETRAQSWSAAGDGLNNNIFTFTRDPGNNILYVGGHFTADGPGTNTINHIASWDGTNWIPVGTGTNLDVYGSCMYNGELYVGGQFTTADGITCNHIAKWNGTAWDSVGGGFNSDVFYLHVYNGELYAAGSFTMAEGNPANRIAKWNGTNWTALGNGLSGTATPQIFSMQVYNSELYVTGQFNDADGVSVNNIAKWNGSAWSDVAGGLVGASEFGVDLIVYNSNLVATGSFATAGGVTSNGIASWNGSAWSAMGSGFTGGGAYGAVMALYSGQLYVGGNFTDVDGVSAIRIASYNGSAWSPLTTGCDNEVDALEAYNGELFAGGAFYNAGGLAVFKVARWSSGCTIVTDANATNISCVGACDGTASVSATGLDPLTYEWSGGQTTDTITGLCPGTYTVTVTDFSGCSVSESVTVIEFPLPSLTMAGTDPVCFGLCNGSASVSATGRAPFTYSWSTIPVQTSDTATGLCAGTYYVTVSDSAGCSSIDSVTINDPTQIILSLSSTNPTCPLSCNGIASVTSNSVFTPFTYSWNTVPAQNTDTATALCEGIYTVTFTDSMGCVAVDSVELLDPVLILDVTSANVSCSGGGCDGTATAIATGPNPFTYLWSNTETTGNIIGLCIGSYTVTATDSLGCILIDSVTIIQSPDPFLNLNYSSPSCFGDCNGVVNAIASGSTGLNYLWSNTETSSSISNACFGWYGVTVTDSLGCSANDSILVLQPDILDVSVNNIINASCNGTCDGLISVTGTGGTPLYSYLWSNSSTLPDQFNLCFGIYTVTVTDAHSCTKEAMYAINEPDTLIVDLTGTDATCQGCNDGTLSNTVTGGTPPYNYFYTPPVPDPGHVTAGTYYLCVTDAHSCQACDSVIISEPNGIFELSNANMQFSVYPNPFRKTAVFQIPSSLQNLNGLKIEFYDLIGKRINEINYSFTGKSEVSISSGSTVKGIYLFKVFNADNIVGAGRFVIE